MIEAFEMIVTDIFRFRDGRIVLVGEVNGHEGYIPRGRFEVRQRGELCGLLDVEGEMIASRSDLSRAPRLRAVSNTTATSLTREFLGRGPLVLRWRKTIGNSATASDLEDSTGNGDRSNPTFASHKESQMHRHLLGVDSPPSNYVADPMTQGPVLPEGWDGDAWEGPGGHGSFLRAWHKPSGRVAYGRGSTYEAARKSLLDDVQSGQRRVEVQVLEMVSN